VEQGRGRYQQNVPVCQLRKHQPDLEIRYDKVKVSLSTHDAGGITENDFKLATFAEQLSDAKTGAT
jgi:pterin-4a-carbinolamine dehydratase